MSKASPTTSEFLSSYDPAIEREFFARVFLPNRTVKTTYEKRLDDLNEASLPHMLRLPNRPLSILDVGASSGISTAEWHEFLAARGIAHEMLATDLAIHATLSGNSRFSVLRDSSGHLLHFDMMGRGFPPHQKGIHLHAVIQFVALVASHIARRSTSVKLLSRRVNGLTAIEDDLTAANRPDFIAAFDVIRAANILNLSYFDYAALSRMLATLKARLVDGGLLIVCRTTKQEQNNGTIFQLRDDRLSVLARTGTGSEIESIIKSSARP